MQKPVIGIIGGKGNMGQLFASFFAERGIKVLISDRKTKLSNKKLAEKSDITIVSVPIDITEKVIAEVLPHIKKGAAIMDFTSVKSPAVKSMLKGKCEVLGVHPMFGSSNPIPGQTVILCPTRKSGPWAKWLEKFLKEHNVKIKTMTAKEHDQTMGIAQALIHFADIAFIDSLRQTKMPIKQLFEFTSKSSELKVQLAARIIQQSSNLYGNIQIANPYTAKMLKHYGKSVSTLAKIIEKKDLKAFEKYFANGRKFLGKYANEAFEDSSYMIDKFLEKKRKTAPKRATQRATKTALAVLGPPRTFSDLAAEKYLSGTNSKLKKYFCNEIEEVIELVAKGKVKQGIVPIENKLHGTVRETLDSLFHKNVHIVSEVDLPINHYLITLTHTKKSDIKHIISHTQALNQCKKYLKKHFPKASKAAYSSTAASIEKLLTSRNRQTAVIAPRINAEHESLKVIAENIEDRKDNSTKFLIIEKGAFRKAPKTAIKTSIAFHFDADSPGSLFTVFKEFADAKINMTKIESRPTRKEFGDYIFYLDFEGSTNESKVKKVLKSLSKLVAKVKILGSY